MFAGHRHASPSWLRPKGNSSQQRLREAFSLVGPASPSHCVSVRLGWAPSDGLMCGPRVCSELGQTVAGVSMVLIGSLGHPWAKSLVLAECEALIGRSRVCAPPWNTVWGQSHRNGGVPRENTELLLPLERGKVPDSRNHTWWRVAESCSFSSSPSFPFHFPH